MFRFALLMMLASSIYAAESAVDIDTAAKIYQAAAIREQVRASLVTMPVQMRELFSRDVSAPLSEQQLAAVTAAAERGFRIDVFEPPALSALAANLDSATVAKAQAFLASDLGRRMVAADVAAATLGEANIDKIMNGELTAPSTPKRDVIVEKLERATRSSRIDGAGFFEHGRGRGRRHGNRLGARSDRRRPSERASPAKPAARRLQESMRVPMRRFLAYAYRSLSDSDLKHLLAFLESPAGKRYVDRVQRLDGCGLRRHG